MWQKLIDTLDKLGEVYDGLIKIGERKHTALVGIDMAGLSKILDEEQLLTAKLQKLEQKRVELLKDLSKSNTNVNESTRAKDFYRSAPSRAVEEKLIQLHDRLSKSVDRASKLRDNNRVLAQCALDAVQGQLNKLSGAAVEPTYSGKGTDIVTHQKKFDYKA
ncbi:MAG: flagellar protein FlgN [Selenomonadaceae bacterium]|nr:flagellar protein FlgN [Selenomonadaceae bacterium]